MLMKQVKEFEDGMSNPALNQINELEEHYKDVEEGFVKPPILDINIIE